MRKLLLIVLLAGCSSSGADQHAKALADREKREAQDREDNRKSLKEGVAHGKLLAWRASLPPPKRFSSGDQVFIGRVRNHVVLIARDERAKDLWIVRYATPWVGAGGHVERIEYTEARVFEWEMSHAYDNETGANEDGTAWKEYKIYRANAMRSPATEKE